MITTRDSLLIVGSGTLGAATFIVLSSCAHKRHVRKVRPWTLSTGDLNHEHARLVYKAHDPERLGQVEAALAMRGLT